MKDSQIIVQNIWIKLFSPCFQNALQLRNFSLVQDLLKTKLQNAEFCVISFNESLNNSTQNSQMDIGIQEAKQVEVRYRDSQFLRHATSGDLLENFI